MTTMYNFASMQAFQAARYAGQPAICDAGGCDAYHDCDGGSQYDD